MKALTLTQPWASLVAGQFKLIETRSWRTEYRGQLAIHAAKGFPAPAKAFAERDVVAGLVNNLPLGKVLAVCRLVGCIRTEALFNPDGSLAGLANYFGRLGEHEYVFGDYSPGRWAWILADIERVAIPVEATGHLGLWEWTHVKGEK